MVNRIISLFFILLLGFPLISMAAQVRALPDRTRLGAGESLQLELRVQGSADGEADLQPLGQDWEILGRSQSSQTQFTFSGGTSRSLTLSLTLMPRRSGAVTIPSLCFGADCSTPLTIQVSAEAAVTPGENAPLLLEVEAVPRQGVVGGQVLVTVRLLSMGINLNQVSPPVPQSEGIQVEMQPLGKDRYVELRRNDLMYQGVERRYVFFPQQAGTLHLPPLQFNAQVATASAARDPFFGNDPFRGSVKTVRRTSQPLDLRIDPPPVDPAHRLWLPARELTLSDDWQGQPPTLRVGEPATRTVQLRAFGLLAAQLPQLKIPLPADWKSYPDQPARQDESDDDGVVGILQQKIALIPTRSGPAIFPAIDLDWYDVGSRQWRRAHLDPLSVIVVPSAGGATTVVTAPPLSPVTSAPPPPAVAAPPAPAGSAPAQSSVELWFWVSLLLGGGLLLAIWLLWRQRSRLEDEQILSPSPPRNNEKEALQALWQATEQNDPQASRQALLVWSRCRWPDSGRHDLERLAAICGEPLATELASLGRALYADAEGQWQGRGLADGVRQWLKEQPKVAEKEGLPPLYPQR